MNEESREKSLTIADLVPPADKPTAQQEPSTANQSSVAASEDGQLAPLFLPDAAKYFRSHWDAVQLSFVDDPKQAVREADGLVAQVMKSLAETFSNERAKIEAQVDETGEASTENLRLALRRYRSFFDRLLSL